MRFIFGVEGDRAVSTHAAAIVDYLEQPAIG
jgi:hypothetical protein